MLFKINFSRALIISFLWHLFWFFMITVVIVPADIRQRRFPDISFLGPILDDGSFKWEFRDWRLLSKGGANRLDKLFLSGEEDTLAAERIESGADTDYLSAKKPYKASIDEILEVEKRLPGPADKEYALGPGRGSYAGIEGEAKARAVLFKPPLPDCRGLIPDTEKDAVEDYYRVKLKILIAPGGNVKLVEKVESFGYPEIDLLAMRYVKKWNFAPLAPDKPQEDQEGELLLRLKVRE